MSVAIDAKRKSAVQSSLVQIAYDNNMANIAVNLFSVFAVIVILWQAGIDNTVLVAWVVFTLVFSAVRYFVTRHVLSAEPNIKNVPDETRSRWLNYYGAGLVIAALSWVPVVFITYESDALTAQFTLLVILSSLSAGATGTLAAQLTYGRLYIAIMLLDGTLALFFSSHPHYILGGLGVLFTIVMLTVHRKNHRVLRRSLELRFENGDLLQALQHERTTLENKVNQRTAELRRLSEHDSLTNALNRHGLRQWIDERCSIGGKKQLFSTIFIDLDRFKQINDGFGHALGDSVLRAVTERIGETLPDGTAICRWGGDEFVAIVPLGEKHGAEFSAGLIGDLRKEIEKPIAIDGRYIHVNFSAGLAPSVGEPAALYDSIRFADLASSEVKRKGRGGSQQYTEEILAGQERTLMIAQTIKEAITKSELSIAVQPIVDARMLEIASYEVLARWESPTLGTVRPDEFIPVAEDLGEIIALGNHILDTAMRKFSEAGLDRSGCKLAVNVSLRQLVSLDFASFVHECLKKYDLKPSVLEMEITESIFDPANRAPIGEILQSFANDGIDIHIDDFGTGYSSLSRLREMPISTLKIDQSFVQKMDDQSKAIIEGTILIARRFGIKVIAEGVETIDQANFLKEMGVDYLQGYLFGRPIPQFISSGKPAAMAALTA